MATEVRGHDSDGSIRTDGSRRYSSADATDDSDHIRNQQISNLSFHLVNAAHPPQVTTGVKMSKHPKAHPYVTKWRWKGITYTATFEFNKENSDEMDGKRLDRAAKEYADLFLKDLEGQLEQAIKDSKTKEGEKKQAIHPGELFEVRIREDGYFIFVPRKEQNIAELSDEEIQAGETKCLKIESEQAIKIASIIAKGITPKLVEGIKKISAINEKPEINLVAPINLTNPHSTRCYFNAPFQMLVHDRLLREHSNDAKNFNDGKNNSLYQAITQYREHKGPGKLDLSNHFKLLGLDIDRRGDALKAWGTFRKQFTSQLKTLKPTIISEGKDINEAISTHPRFLCLEFPPKYSRELRDDVTDEEKDKFIASLEDEKVKESLKKNWDKTVASNALENLRQVNPKAAREHEEVLYKGEKIESENQIDIKKGNTLIINSATYKVASVLEYTGNAFRGHYVSYITDENGKFWKINDLEKQSESITAEEFQKAALRGTLLILHKEGAKDLISKPRTKNRKHKIVPRESSSPSDSATNNSPSENSKKAPQSGDTETDAAPLSFAATKKRDADTDTDFPPLSEERPAPSSETG